MFKRAIAVSLLALLAAFSAGATTVIPLYLDELIDGAAIAFQGTCTDNRSQRDPQNGMIVTYTTFAVADVLKGQVGSSYTIKQIGGRLADEGLQFRIEGVPSFAVGQSYVVFLPGVSGSGFSSPVGLSQGKFNVLDGATGSEVTNGRDFRDLTSRMAAQTLPPSLRSSTAEGAPVARLGLQEFKSLVRQRVGAPQ